MFELVEHHAQNARIKVVGVGGGGGNAINTMMECGLDGVEFIAANTDMQALRANGATVKVQLGRELTKGLGAGANPEVGRNAALEDQRAIAEHLEGADMVFITAGMGGGTGTGGAPVLAKLAKDMGALTVGVVTKPFAFEGRQRGLVADRGITEIRGVVDTLITIPNEKLLSVVAHDVTVIDAFKQADQILYQAVKGISDLITIHGLINLDFADVRTVMNEMGMALMGSGSARGSDRAVEAATKAISSPLLEDTSIKGATGILINITGGPNMTLHEISEASKIIQTEAHEDANILFGAVIDENMAEEISVTVIATGFNKPLAKLPRSPSAYQTAGTYQRPKATPSRPMPVPVHIPSLEPRPSFATVSGLGQVVSRPRGGAYPVGASRQVPGTSVSSDGLQVSLKSQEPKAELKDVGLDMPRSEYQVDEYDIPTFLRKQAD